MMLEKQDVRNMDVLKRSISRSSKSPLPATRDSSTGRLMRRASGVHNHINPYNLTHHHDDHININYNGIINDADVKKKYQIERQGKPLEVIDLSGMFLNCIPYNPNATNLASIFKLDLSNNNLQIIPESITARLLNVVVLDVHSNQLSSLPNSIGCLSKLKILNVSGNLLSSIPKAIENCKSLEELDANFNKLTTLSDTMGFELPNLKKLSVNSNKLVLLPYSLSHLTTLRNLDVRLNCLRSLPDDLENLINLQILNISQNFQYLTTLPYSVGLLLSLIELDASYNTITRLPSSIGCLRKLQKLNVEGNPLISPPMDVIEHGLHAVKKYMNDKINNGDRDPKKKFKLFGQFKRYGTISSNARHGRNNMHGSKIKGFVKSEYRPVDALASPRYLRVSMLSPRRLFSTPCRT